MDLIIKCMSRLYFILTSLSTVEVTIIIVVILILSQFKPMALPKSMKKLYLLLFKYDLENKIHGMN